MPTTHSRRLRVLATAALVGVLLPAGPALAHASLDVRVVPAASTTDVVLRVPVEREDAGNDRVEVLLPDGFAAPSCDAPTGWTCTVGAEGDAVLLVFARDGGDDEVERFGFALTAGPTQGDVVLPTIQGYTDGGEVAWIGAGGDRPAPALTIGPPATAVEENTAAVDDAPLDAPPADGATAPAAEATPTSGDVVADDGAADVAGPEDAPDGEGTADGTDEDTLGGVPVVVAAGLLGALGVLLLRRRG